MMGFADLKDLSWTVHTSQFCTVMKVDKTFSGVSDKRSI